MSGAVSVPEWVRDIKGPSLGAILAANHVIDLGNDLSRQVGCLKPNEECRKLAALLLSKIALFDTEAIAGNAHYKPAYADH
jgi:hypothetical protein